MRIEEISRPYRNLAPLSQMAVLRPLRKRAKITSHFAEVGQTPRAPFSKFGVRPNNLIKQGSDPTENGARGA